MPTSLELWLGAAIGAFVVLGLAALRRSDSGPMPYWVAGWMSAGLGGVLVLTRGTLPWLALLGQPLGTLFPWLLLAGTLALRARRPPAWLLPVALAFGVARAAVAATGRADLAYGMALVVEPPLTLVAGWLAHRELSRPEAGIGERLLGPTFVALAGAGAFHLVWLMQGRDPNPVLAALWIVMTPPVLGLQIWAASAVARRDLRSARDALEERVAERTRELGLANAALRESEERYRTVSELSSDFSFAFRIDRELYMTLEWVTGAFERVTGADPHALEGRGWLDFLDAEARTRIGELFAGTAPGRQVVRELSMRSRDGEEHWLEVRAHTLPGERPEALRVVGSARDVTALRRAEAERRDLERRTQESERLESLGRLSGGIAHDFNNLLSVILGNVSLVESDLPPDAPARERLARIRRAADHAARLTDQMLTYAGKAPLDRKVIDVSETVSRALELLRTTLPEPCELDADLEPELRIEADEAQIQQLLLNLVANAGEALPEGRGQVRVRTYAIGAEQAEAAGARGVPDVPSGEYVVLEVRDSGRGIDPATRARVFEPFFTTKFTGRGMGLATVLGIVRSHGGVTSVESEPGTGTTVRALLPRVERREAAPPMERALSAESGRGAARILVVDDDEAVLEVACEFLRRAGYRVDGARGGRAGIERLREDRDAFDAVVLDLSMPDVSGEQAFLEMRKIRPDLPVLLTTGFSEELASERFQATGAAGFVGKPFSASELIGAVEKALAGARPRA